MDWVSLGSNFQTLIQMIMNQDPIEPDFGETNWDEIMPERQLENKYNELVQEAESLTDQQ